MERYSAFTVQPQVTWEGNDESREATPFATLEEAQQFIEQLVRDRNLDADEAEDEGIHLSWLISGILAGQSCPITSEETELHALAELQRITGIVGTPSGRQSTYGVQNTEPIIPAVVKQAATHVVAMLRRAYENAQVQSETEPDEAERAIYAGEAEEFRSAAEALEKAIATNQTANSIGDVRQGDPIPGYDDNRIAVVIFTPEDIMSAVNNGDDTEDEDDPKNVLTYEQAKDYLGKHGRDLTRAFLTDYWADTVAQIDSLEEYIAALKK